jgi:23S rRNA pseudouridine2604 synthase
MARRGLCSRREAERLIAAGQVLVDGQPVSEQGVKAAPDVDIVILDAGRSGLASRLTVLLHKPVGVVSVLPQRGQLAASQLLRAARASGAVEPALRDRVEAEAESFAVAGRLDRASRGLLLLTQDGVIARAIIGGTGVNKTYLVRTAAAATDEQLRKLRGRMMLDGRVLRPMRVDRHGAATLRFVLDEGRKHQIRRVCDKVGLEVVDLFRTAIGPFAVADLPEGRWRLVTAGELADLRR